MPTKEMVIAWLKQAEERLDNKVYPTLVILSFTLSFFFGETWRLFWLKMVGFLMIGWFLACIVDFFTQQNPDRIKRSVVGLFRFAYIFTILSIVLLMLPFSPWMTQTLAGKEVAGFSLFPGCLATTVMPQTSNSTNAPQGAVYALGTPLLPKCADSVDASASTAKNKKEKAAGADASSSASGGAAQADTASNSGVASTSAESTSSAKTDEAKQESQAYVWLVSIGGVSGDRVTKGANDEFQAIRVRDGLVLPLYIVLLSVMGAAVSLSRRLPEYQRQARLDSQSHDGQTLSLAEAKEKVVFELMQLISAPLIVFAAFAAITPASPGVAIVLAFATGFASESILCAIRAVTDGLRPANSAKQSAAAATGQVRVTVFDTKANAAAVKRKVFLKEYARYKVTDDKGDAIFDGIPIGKATIEVEGVPDETIEVKSGTNPQKQINV